MLIACWHLFLNFVQNLINNVVNLPLGSETIGWKDQYPGDIQRGVRVWLYGFACTGGQSVPLIFSYGEKLGNASAFANAFANADATIPDGGTCPGAVINKVVADVQGNDLLTRPYKAAFLFTDGVFYDMPVPKEAEQGLFYFGVMTYALGISIPYQGVDFGLTPQEIKTQHNQLLDFVDNQPSRLFNFGTEGLMILNQIAQELANQLPHDVVSNKNKIIEPYWCGYTNEIRCTEMNPVFTATGIYCKWNNFQRKCFPKDYCKFTKKQCLPDPYCNWAGKKCFARGTPSPAA